MHHHSPKSGVSSFFLDNEDELKNISTKFLWLNNLLPENMEVIEHWETFAESTSSDYILKLAQLMDESNISYCVNSAQYGSLQFI